MREPSDSRPADEIIAAECLAVRLRALNRAVTAIYDDALRPHGLRVGQLNLLVAVSRIGTARPGDLCRVLQMEKSTLSRDLQVMCRNGWLKVPAEGRRARIIQLSPEGTALLKRVVPAWQDAQKRARKLLGDDGSRALLKTANRLFFGTPSPK
jgi:DNA-binding MarR family transcriptional regulator